MAPTLDDERSPAAIRKSETAKRRQRRRSRGDRGVHATLVTGSLDMIRKPARVGIITDEDEQVAYLTAALPPDEEDNR
jgi:hypothetical protein